MLADKLTPFINRYDELSTLLSSPDITSDIKKMTELSKEQSNLLPIVEKAKEYKALLQEIADSKEMLSDPEMSDMAKEELKELQSIADKKLESFDSAYYSEILKKEKYDLDDLLYRPYIEQKNVVNGMFKFLNKLFGIEFKRVEEKLWDKKAFSYDLYLNSKIKARLYLDLESREPKRGGAWMHNFQTHCKKENGEEQLASAFIVCNFPASSDTNPSLLRHDDVVTLFHEMGHAIHHIFSKASHRAISGVNGVAWDVIEFPSQFLENFSFDRNFLKSFAKHDLTGEQLPDEMIDKLIKARNFQSAMQMVRQLEFGLFDFKLHSELYQADEVQKLLDEIRKEISPLLPPKYNKFQNSFTHIFAGGYAAGYYSYKWAEVLSADLYFEVLENSDLWQKYKTTVLQNGAIKSMSKLFQELLSRKPDPSKLLKLSGIKN